MLILTGYETNSKTEVLCHYCLKPVGLFTQEEIGAMARGMNEPVICFDCDGKADSVYPGLCNEDGRFLLSIDQTLISVDVWKEVRAQAIIIDRKNQKISELYDHLIQVFGGIS